MAFKRKQKVAFVDRDGTINYDFGYVHRIRDLRFLPNAIRGLQLLQSIGFQIFIMTNQSGIGRGLFTEKVYRGFTKSFLKQLRSKGVRISGIHHCPHLPTEGCACRKPQLKHYRAVIHRRNVNIRSSVCIGDKTEDVAAGSRLGCSSILVQTGKAGKDKKYKARADFTARDLLHAAQWLSIHE
jgi:D-glycero-D-manno-heptose 1,7-bisphosphate phosphatase